MPIANPGYWKSNENDTAFLPCNPKESCLGNGSASAECAAGYTGTRCGECESGYYRLFQTCRTCTTAVPDWVLPILFLLGIFVLGAVAVLLRKGPSSGLLNIGLNFIQIITIFDYTLEFSPILRSTLQILTVSQFNVEISAPECLLTKAHITDTYDIRFKFTFSLILPALLLGLCSLIAIVNSYPIIWFCNRVIGAVAGVFQSMRGRKTSKFCSPKEEMIARQSRSVLQSLQIFNMLLGIIYIMLVNYSLTIFDCTLQPDQNFYLDSQPNAKCYEDWHPEYSKLGIVAIVLYVLGIPFYFGTLLFFFYQSKFFTPNWNRAREIASHVLDISNSYFKEGHQYFIVIQLIRKLLIVSIKLFLER
ncbi:hypothetical protein BKA69DRAFT_526092 [Paraphysoderma sedebokerense]|nr:hypothetical protein BKA69DRAFT_526092 [Paraphysoderma sedebokerense]